MQRYLERAAYEWSEDSVRLIHTANQNTKRTFFYVQETGVFKTKPPYFTERENLDSFLLVYTISGEGILQIDGDQYDVMPGQLFWIPCMKHHYYACKRKGWEILWLHFNGIAARGYYEEFAKGETPVVLIQRREWIKEQFGHIISLVQKRDAHSELLISNDITNMLTEILMTDHGNESIQSQMPDYVKLTIKEIDKHFQEDLSLEQLAAQVGVSKYYLLKQFKKYVGCTIGEYCTTTRLNYAKELLKYSEESVNEITFSCGMNNVSHFINMFRKHEHMTPLQYRKKWG